MARIKTIDLMKLSSGDPLWEILIKMTLESSPYYKHAARHMLRRLRREIAAQERAKKNGTQVAKNPFSHADAILLMENGEIMAHNLVLKERRDFQRILHAFTKNKYRKMGLQKRLLKYTSKRYPALYFWTNTKAREKTFAYYRGTRMLD